MNLDLADLESWSDEDLLRSLNEIEDGLTENQITWIERFNARMDDNGRLSDRQREVAEDILRAWNGE